MHVHVICANHNRTAIVGRGTLLSELECVDCVAERDRANRWSPCCAAMNTTCCGHDDEPALKWSGVTLVTADYCNTFYAHDLHAYESADVPF